MIPDPDDFYDVQQVSIGLINVIKAKYIFDESRDAIKAFIDKQSKDIGDYFLEECEKVKN